MKWCDIHLFLISNAMDGGGRLNPLTRRHLAGCSACREVYRKMNHLNGLLIEKGADLRREAMDEHHARPLPQGIQTVTKRAVPRQKTGWGRGWLPAAALAAVVMMVIFGVRFLRDATIVSPQPARRPVMEVKTQIQSLTESIAATRLDDPMEQELTGLIETAKDAAGFLRSRVRKVTGLAGNES